MSDRPGHHDEEERAGTSSSSNPIAIAAMVIAIVALASAFLVPRFMHQVAAPTPTVHDEKLSIRVDSVVIALTAANTKIDSLEGVATKAERIYTEGTSTNESRAAQLDEIWKYGWWKDPTKGGAAKH